MKSLSKETIIFNKIYYSVLIIAILASIVFIFVFPDANWILPAFWVVILALLIARAISSKKKDEKKAFKNDIILISIFTIALVFTLFKNF